MGLFKLAHKPEQLQASISGWTSWGVRLRGDVPSESLAGFKRKGERLRGKKWANIGEGEGTKEKGFFEDGMPPSRTYARKHISIYRRAGCSWLPRKSEIKSSSRFPSAILAYMLSRVSLCTQTIAAGHRKGKGRGVGGRGEVQ